MRELWVTRLGRVDYDSALQLQHKLHDARAHDRIADTLLLLEHTPVYTRGRRSTSDELTMAPEFYAERGIEIRDVDRGGKVTYHGPSQLTGYLIADTHVTGRDIPRLVGQIEQALIDALAEETIDAHRDPAGRGVWAGDGEAAGKIGSIGLHIADNVTTHGFAVNVSNDLAPFEWIRPCGLDDPATSVAKVTGRPDRMKCFQKRVAFQVARQFGLRQRLVSRERLERAAAPELVSAA